MKFRLVLPGVVLALLLMPASAVAAGSNTQASTRHDHREFQVAGSFTDTDFCGTGKTVEVKSEAMLFLHGATDDMASHGRSRTLFVNPQNDAWVAMKSGGALKWRKVAEAGGFKVVASLRGAPAVIWFGKDDAFRSRDPGYVLYVLHFSEKGELLSSEIMQRKIDPAENRAFKRLCRIAIYALGL